MIFTLVAAIFRGLAGRNGDPCFGLVSLRYLCWAPEHSETLGPDLAMLLREGRESAAELRPFFPVYFDAHLGALPKI